jgi:hypothetical protein
MLKFISRLTLGVILGVSASAVAARVVGDNGTLTGWSVVIQGEEAFSDPEVDMASMEISCE